MCAVLRMLVAQPGRVDYVPGAGGRAGVAARLYLRSPGSPATALLRDCDIGRQVVTLDRWRSQ